MFENLCYTIGYNISIRFAELSVFSFYVKLRVIMYLYEYAQNREVIAKHRNAYFDVPFKRIPLIETV